MGTRTAWLGLIVILTTSCGWADTPVDVYVNGEKQDFSPPAQVREGITYAPLRAAGEAVGAEVKWQAEQQIAMVCKGTRCTLIRKSQGVIIQQRLLVPLRLMAEALDADVAGDAERKVVTIQTLGSSPE